MGDERREQKVKQQRGSGDPIRKRTADLHDEERAAEETDTAHIDRQLQLRAAPGFTAPLGPDRRFLDTGADQAKLWPEVEAILDGNGDGTQLAAKVADLDISNRNKVAMRIDDAAKVAPGADVLQIGDLVGLPAADKLRAGLFARSAPSAPAVRAHAIAATADDLVALLDAKARDRLKALFPAPLTAVPQIPAMAADIAKQRELVSWWIAETPATELALAMMRIPSQSVKPLSATLNAIGGHAWDWVASLTEAMVGSAQMVGQHLEFEPSSDSVRAALQAKTPAKHAGAAPGGAKALTALVPERGVDVEAVIRAAADATTYERNEAFQLTRAPYRKRLTDAATIPQLTLLLNHLGVYDADQLDWVLDRSDVTIETVAQLSATWSAGSVALAVAEPKLLTKLRTKLPTASPLDLFGVWRDGVYGLVEKTKAVRAWCVATAQPRELVRMITQERATIAKVWNLLVADGLAPTWVHGLGVGDTDDTALRTLALHCPDPASATWIRQHVLGDFNEKQHASSTPQAIPAIAAEPSAGKRLDEGLAAGDLSPDELGRRTSELSDADLAKLRANPDQLETVLASLEGEWLGRFLSRAQIALPIALRHADLFVPQLAAYIRTRPSTETTATFADPQVATRVMRRIATPFVTFPALREPAVLAASVKQDGVLEWLLEHTDAPYALSLLGQPEVAPAAGKVFAQKHLKLLPRTLSLSKPQHQALARIADAVPLDDIADALRERNDTDTEHDTSEQPAKSSDGERDAQLEQNELEIALLHKDLAGALDVVLAKPATRANVLAVCRERAAGAMELLTKPEHAKRVAQLHQVLRLSPVAVFPSVPWYALLHTNEARAWLFEDEPASEILHELAQESQLANLVFARIDERDPVLQTWLANLPRGSALTVHERTQVRTIFDMVASDRAARLLFELRFGARVHVKTFTHDELARYWTLFERVPDAHVAQDSIRDLAEDKPGNLPGQFGGGVFHVVEGLAREGKTNTQYDQALQLTRTQLTDAYGYDDQQLQAHIDAQEIKVVETAAGTRYELQPQKVPLLDFTVLHEIGHAVDEMLGEHTELVFGLADWHQYNEADFDQFAKDLGGWDRVRPADQTRIRDVWLTWLNAKSMRGIDQFVDDDHPALSKKYPNVGIVELGRRKSSPSMSDAPMNGYHVLVHEKYQQWYRVPDRTRNAAPSNYAMTAPKEFFAECYAEYYWEFKGPGTEDKKGGRLPGWIKTWFDRNIDTLKHNPSRR